MQKSWQRVDRDLASTVLIFADGAAFAICRLMADVLYEFASRKIIDVAKVVGERGLRLGAPKSFDWVASYGAILDGVLR